MAAKAVKKTAPTAAAAPVAVAPEERHPLFSELRERAALRTRGQRPKQDRDFVIPLDPEVRVTFPLGVVEERDFTYALRAKDEHKAMVAVLGIYDYQRVIDVLAGQKDSAELFSALVDRFAEHYAGPGAGDVPGGSRQS